MTVLGEPRAWLTAPGGESWTLQANCSLGRGAGNTIVVNDPRVSRRHAVIHRQDKNEFWFVDLGSGNGSYVNSRRVSLPTRLQDGDALSIGDMVLTFRQEDAPVVTPPDSTTTMSLTVIEIKNVVYWLLIADIIGSTTLAQKYDSSTWPTLVGSWTKACRKVIDDTQGSINKYLGDGFLAIWRADQVSPAEMEEAFRALRDIQAKSELPFRLALHYGEVALGGSPGMGEDSLSGFELVFLFRMEKLTGKLGHTCMISHAAKDQLPDEAAFECVGDHVIEGFVDTKPRPFYRPV